MTAKVATIDFHVTSECSQECPYCWGPQDYETPVDTDEARRIIRRIKDVGARRIVFTGGDPLKRSDTATLIRHASEVGLEVALSTTGDELTAAFLDEVEPFVDLISLPLDGSTKGVNARTKEPGHHAAILRTLDWLRERPRIDVKVCTPVTRLNVNDVLNILAMVESYAATTKARVFYNIFHAFPRSMSEVDWEELLVSEEEFTALARSIAHRQATDRQAADGVPIRVNFLSHETLDRLYVMIFPDGSVVIPRGSEYYAYGQFLENEDLDSVLERSRFDSPGHLRHSLGWSKTPRQV